MQPGDEAIIAFVVTVFVAFSALMAYASYLGSLLSKDQ